MLLSSNHRATYQQLWSDVTVHGVIWYAPSSVHMCETSGHRQHATGKRVPSWMLIHALQGGPHLPHHSHCTHRDRKLETPFTAPQLKLTGILRSSDLAYRHSLSCDAVRAPGAGQLLRMLYQRVAARPTCSWFYAARTHPNVVMTAPSAKKARRGEPAVVSGAAKSSASVSAGGAESSDAVQRWVHFTLPHTCCDPASWVPVQ